MTDRRLTPARDEEFPPNPPRGKRRERKAARKQKSLERARRYEDSRTRARALSAPAPTPTPVARLDDLPTDEQIASEVPPAWQDATRAARDLLARLARDRRDREVT